MGDRLWPKAGTDSVGIPYLRIGAPRDETLLRMSSAPVNPPKADIRPRANKNRMPSDDLICKQHTMSIRARWPTKRVGH